MNNRIMNLFIERQDDSPKLMKLAIPIVIETVLFMLLSHPSFCDI